MKILFFISSLRSGGAERVLSLLANDWQTQGHEITIAIERDNVFYDVDKSIQIIDTSIEPASFSEPITNNIKRILKYKTTILKVDPDIVIAFMTATCIKAIIASKLSNKPIISSEHTNFLALNSKSWRFLRRVIYPFANALIVLTTYDKTNYYFHKNIHIIENPLVLVNNHKNIKREKTILAIGSLYQVKGFDRLLEAFANLKKSDDWRLVILGEGNERVNLENQAKKLKISERVQFLGVVSDVEQYYKKASVFVLSSRWEGFPVALCEAMAYGCPPVAFNCLTGPGDIIEDGKSGLLVEPDNIEALSNSIQSLIDNPQKRDHLSKNAIKIEERLNINKISRQWFGVIEKVLKTK